MRRRSAERSRLCGRNEYVHVIEIGRFAHAQDGCAVLIILCSTSLEALAEDSLCQTFIVTTGFGCRVFYNRAVKGGVQMASTALITGGTSGIGRAVANKLAQLGIHVLVVGRNRERGEKTVAEIRATGGQADFISSNLRDASSAGEVAKRAVELGGGHVDILINNAGIFPFGPTHETTEETFDSVYSLNVKAPYFLVAGLAPLMAKRGKGAIVNVSTMVADYGAPGMSLYGSSKAAINLLTKAWAAEYGPKGVRVNAVSPGPTRTEGTDAMGEGVEQLAAQAPAGRPATADEIAEAIVFLATDRASFIHGAKLAVDGGRTAV